MCVLLLIWQADALEQCTAGELVQLYVALIAGHGRRAELDEAHAAFIEGSDHLDKCRKRIEPAGSTASGSSSGAGASEGASSAVASGEEWGEREWRAAERALTRAMVDAAAPHPRGLLLACNLLEQLTRRRGQGLKHAYYSQLISGHATAHDLHIATEALQGAQREGAISSAWRVSDGTIAALMAALTSRQVALGTTEGNEPAVGQGVASKRVARDEAMDALGTVGIQMDRRVAEYLASGRRANDGGRPTKRPVNANDELVLRDEFGTLGAMPAPGVRLADYDYSTSRKPTALNAAEAQKSTEARADAQGEADGLGGSDGVLHQYEQFEKMLAMREERPTLSRPQPATRPQSRKSTTRSAEQLSNLFIEPLAETSLAAPGWLRPCALARKPPGLRCLPLWVESRPLAAWQDHRSGLHEIRSGPSTHDGSRTVGSEDLGLLLL